MGPPRDIRSTSREETENLRTEVENLTEAVAKLLAANGFLKQDEIQQLRALIQERSDAKRNRANLRIYTGYFAATVVFFYTIREYVTLFWAWLKASLR